MAINADVNVISGRYNSFSMTQLLITDELSQSKTYFRQGSAKATQREIDGESSAVARQTSKPGSGFFIQTFKLSFQKQK